VLYDDWTVNCYDNRLQLLWSEVLLDVNHPWRRYNVRTAGILISPHSLSLGDNGTVIVAASFVHIDHNIRFASLSPQFCHLCVRSLMLFFCVNVILIVNIKCK